MSFSSMISAGATLENRKALMATLLEDVTAALAGVEAVAEASPRTASELRAKDGRGLGAETGEKMRELRR